MWDAWLFGSRTEGLGLPILEVMASKKPVIATLAGAATDVVSESCGCIVEADNSEAMCQKIIEFSEMSLTDCQRNPKQLIVGN
jgi:glycosyltransferase involved in cell wall biosynthesis